MVPEVAARCKAGTSSSLLVRLGWIAVRCQALIMPRSMRSSSALAWSAKPCAKSMCRVRSNQISCAISDLAIRHHCDRVRLALTSKKPVTFFEAYSHRMEAGQGWFGKFPTYRTSERSCPSKRAGGAWGVGFRLPMNKRQNARRNLESILHELKLRWAAWKSHYRAWLHVSRRAPEYQSRLLHSRARNQAANETEIPLFRTSLRLRMSKRHLRFSTLCVVEACDNLHRRR